MDWKKEECPNDQSNSGRYSQAVLLAAETLRKAQGPVMVPTPGKEDERVSVFWRLFGGTLLSIAALVCITVYQQFNSSLTDIRNDLNRLTQERAELVKQEAFNGRMTSVWSSIKDLQTANTATAALTEKISLLEKQLKASDDERKEMARAYQQLRERLATVEGRQSAHVPAPSPTSPAGN